MAVSGKSLRIDWARVARLEEHLPSKSHRNKNQQFTGSDLPVFDGALCGA